MAITPEIPGQIDTPNVLTSEAEGEITTPNTLTSEAAGSISIPNDLTSETEGAISAPNSLTSETEGQVSTPNNLTSEAAGTVSTPNNLTSEAAGTVDIPNALTNEAAGTVSAPNNLTSEAAGTVSAPNTLTSQTAAAVNRALCPRVSMDFAGENFAQCGNPVYFEDLFTYSRSSAASFINRRKGCNGGWEYYLDTDYVGDVENLLTYSEQFDNAAWIKTRSSIIANAARASDGTMTADKLVEDATASNTHLTAQTKSFTSGVQYTYSVEIKASERKQTLLRFNATAFPSSADALFDIQGGVIIFVGAGSNEASIEFLGDGWYRCSITSTADATASAIVETRLAELGTSSYSGDGVSGLFIAKTQLTESAKPLPYVKTISTSVAETFTETLRHEYDSETGEDLGVLIEGDGTNLALRSEEFGDATWAKSRCGVIENSAQAPDETTGADKLVDDLTANNTHTISQSATTNASTDLTFSVYCKAAERSQIRLRHNTLALDALFDVIGGTVMNVDAGVIASIKHITNGWYRCSISLDSGAGGVQSFAYSLAKDGSVVYDGDGSSGLYIWGAQLEEQPFITSYIRTEGSAASRAKDILDFGVAGNITEGPLTIYTVTNMCLPDTGTGSERSIIRQVGASSEAAIRISASGGVSGQIGEPSLVIASSAETSAKSELDMKTAITFDGSQELGFFEGELTDTESSTSLYVPDNLSTIRLGRNSDTAGFLNGHIKRIEIYDVALTAQEVATL